MEIPINKPAESESEPNKNCDPIRDSERGIGTQYIPILLKVYVGLMVFGAPIPRVTSHHDFPMNLWEPHFRCTKIYMGNGLVDNSTVPNCPMPNCASRNRSPTSFVKNPEELRPLAWLVLFQSSGGVWCEVVEKL